MGREGKENQISFCSLLRLRSPSSFSFSFIILSNCFLKRTLFYFNVTFVACSFAFPTPSYTNSICQTMCAAVITENCFRFVARQMKTEKQRELKRTRDESRKGELKKRNALDIIFLKSRNHVSTKSFASSPSLHLPGGDSFSPTVGWN